MACVNTPCRLHIVITGLQVSLYCTDYIEQLQLQGILVSRLHIVRSVRIACVNTIYRLHIVITARIACVLILCRLHIVGTEDYLSPYIFLRARRSLIRGRRVAPSARCVLSLKGFISVVWIHSFLGKGVDPLFLMYEKVWIHLFLFRQDVDPLIQYIQNAYDDKAILDCVADSSNANSAHIALSRGPRSYTKVLWRAHYYYARARMA